MAFSFLIFGCQNEIDETIEAPKEEVFNQVSPVADLVQRTALRDGSADNIVDGSSCSSLVLPITVIVNGLEITLDSKEDFYAVEYIIDEFDDDDDLIEILFPVTVILADYSELILGDEDDLEDLIDQCTEGGDDDDIECVDFKYPLDISIFNSENELSDVITIHDDEELHDFIDGFDAHDVASFNFPITVVLSDGAEMVISDNDELEDVLEDAVDACDEDDDNDHNDDDDEEDSEDSELFDALVEGEWIISYFFDDSDGTSDFAGYTFAFNPDGTALADNGSGQINGAWQIESEDGGKLELKLEFGETDLFVSLEDDWDVLEFDGTIIKLMDEDTSEESKRFLNFKRPS